MMLPNLKDARVRTKNEVLVNNFLFDEKYKDIALGKKYFVKTYGCQMNEHESENICALLELMGYVKVDIMEEADLIILNTCSIRENAHNKVFGMLGRIKHLKATKKDLLVGLMGCMAQEEVVATEILNKYKWMNFVLGTHKMEELCEIVYQSMYENGLKIDAPSIEGSIVEGLPVNRNSKYKAYVNIMYGCDKFCTYCIVPYTRGKQRSRRHEDILNEVRELVRDGYMEVTLLGQNVNAYGKDLNDNYGMADLLRDVALTGIPRVRFMTSHPWDFTPEMIDVISKYDNIMKCIHLPVQSGNSDILKLMGRRYTKEDYLNLVSKIKDKIPNCALTTDIIVGFPNETEEQFNDTLEVVNICKYDLAYTFIYSKRVGTPASVMKDSITLEEKEKRLYRLNELVNKYALLNNQKYQDKVVNVLLEEKSDKEGYLSGYTDTNKLVNVKAPLDYLGLIVPVKITSVKTWSLDGEVINDRK